MEIKQKYHLQNSTKQNILKYKSSKIGAKCIKKSTLKEV